MVADRSDEGLYMTVEQYLALDEATDGKYEYLDGYAYLLRPPSSAYQLTWSIWPVALPLTP